MVSCVVLTEAPLDALPLPLVAIALVAALRARFAVAAALVLLPDAPVDPVPLAAAAVPAPPDVALPVVVPYGDWVVCVPLAVPPAVLT
jgi:hypothetical protein